MNRPVFLQRIETLFRSHPMVGILGPRQCGKTTLARDYLAERPEPQVHYFDLEDPDHLNRLADPKLALERLEGLIVIDEIQRSPDLFPLLRVLVDRRPRRQRHLILGSASRELIRQSSETLAGRIAYLELPPFTALHAAVAALDLNRLTVVYPGDGAYPLTERIRVAGLGSLVAEKAESRDWRRDDMML